MFTSAKETIIKMVTYLRKAGAMSRMTLSERIAIEAGIYARKHLTEIAESIHKSRRHVSEEIRRNGTRVTGEHPYGKICRNATGCRRRGLCGKADCSHKCCTCRELDCQSICTTFHDGACNQLKKAPYVCNVYVNCRKCKLDRVYCRCCFQTPLCAGTKQASCAR